MRSSGEIHNDKFNLERFISAQKDYYEAAISELRAGENVSYWMWFTFPQVFGLGTKR